MIKAFVRRDLIKNGEFPACSEKVEGDIWRLFKFEVLPLHFEDFETEEGFNMIIKHPISSKKLFVCSIDFDFVEEK